MNMLAFPMQREASGASGALVKMPGFESGANSVLVYFMCDDCAVEAARVKKAVGRIQKEKTSIDEYGFIDLIFDTEGNMVGLHSMKKRSARGAANASRLRPRSAGRSRTAPAN